MATSVGMISHHGGGFAGACMIFPTPGKPDQSKRYRTLDLSQ
jgi:hypothetical protein